MKAGVYVFINNQIKDFYIGSNTRFITRIKNHYSQIKKAVIKKEDKNLSKFYKEVIKFGGNLGNFSWRPLHISNNYYLDFIYKHKELSNDTQIFRVLDSFTKFEVRLLEQALISFLKPQYNNKIEVDFPVNWNPLNKYINKGGSRPVTAITKEDIRF